MNHTRLGGLLVLAAALSILASMAPVAMGAAPTEQLPKGAKVVRLEARPTSLHLPNAFAYNQLVLLARLESGDVIDATRMAHFEAPAGLLTLSARGLARPVADGTGKLVARLGAQQIEIPVKVEGQKAAYPVSYVRDVTPAMSKVGCNAGTCHGSAQGKAGFKLSLRGYDPLFDHRALTDDLEGRRFNRAAPERSLMLMKTSGVVPHVGGALMRPGEPHYELLRAWIAEGVKLDLDAPRVARIEVYPPLAVLPLPEMNQQLAVIAHYTDGSQRDVTVEAFVESSNTEVAKVDSQGMLTAIRRGETTMLARYEGAYAAAQVIVMGDRSGFVWQEQPTNNEIDRLVYNKLRQVKVLPSDICTDAEFLRRVYLDLTGTLPPVETVRAFLKDSRPQRVKREEVIDHLIGSEDFVEHWTNKWSDLLQVNRKFLGENGAWALRSWIKQAIASNMPHDEFARALLTAKGSSIDNPPAAYYKVLRTADAVMENTTHLFLAVRFNCNKCHDHPFERWTQDQYYSLAAYFAQVGRKADQRFVGQMVGGTNVESAQPLVEVLFDQGGGEITHDRTGQVAKPVFPYSHADMPDPKLPRRQQLAHWLTSRRNPYFAKSYVNRIWSYLLGLGIIEPIDDIRAGNPPSNPELLDHLTKEFIASGYDTRKLMREICQSRVYQHSLKTNKWNADDELNYSHALARRLPAEVLYDALHQATGATTRLPELPAGFRAAQLVDSNVDVPGRFFDTFGRPPRESACECERSNSMMLGPILNLVNGPVIAEAIRASGNHIQRLVDREKDDAKLIDELFLTLLSRPATKEEIAATMPTFQALRQEQEQLVSALARYEREQMPARQAEWEKGLASQGGWATTPVRAAKSTGGAVLTAQADGAVLVSGPNPQKDVYTVTTQTGLSNITGIRLEALPDPSLPMQGPGRALNGNFVLTELRLTAAPVADPTKAKRIPLRNARANFSQDQWLIAGAIDNNEQSGWAVSPQFGKRHVAVFELAEPIPFAGEVALTFTLEQKFAGNDHNLGKFRLAVTNALPPIPFEGLPGNIVALATKPADQRTPAEATELANYFRALDSERVRLEKAVRDYQSSGEPRLQAAQDLAWALLNNPAFLFNH